MKTPDASTRRILTVLPLAIALALAICGCATVPVSSIDWKASDALVKGIGRLDGEAWRADLDFLVRTLESRHPNPWHTASRDGFLDVLLGSQMPALTRSQLARQRVYAVARALALLQEGHTRLVGDPLGDILPLVARKYADGFYVVAAAGAGEKLAGGRLVSLDGLSMDEVRRRLRAYVGAENEGWADGVIADMLLDAETLKDAGVLPEDAASVRVEAALAGGAAALDVPLMPLADARKSVRSVYTIAGIKPVDTLSRAGEPYWYKLLKEEKAVLVQYNACTDASKGPGFAQFCDDLFACIERERPERLVLDLRNNGGGNSALFTGSFLPKIRASYLNGPGGIVVLISPKVFSSGVFAAWEMKRDTKAVFAGEPTGQGANHYGYTGRFMLPNSGLVIQHSSRYWKLDPAGGGETITPDVSLPADAAAILSGKDPIADAAVRLGR